MVKVSVIMPVFNAELYLRSAINSIVEQNYDGYELILVNDGSTDGSPAICDEYASKYSQVHVIHQENGGICSARNTGLKSALGDYIMFCDDDDIYLPGFIQTAYEQIRRLDLDLLRFQCVINDEKKEKTDWEYFKLKDIEYSQFLNLSGPLFVWNAIYRASVIHEYQIFFDEKYKYGLEDFDFNLQFYLKMKNAAVSSQVFYQHYEHAKHSTSSNRGKEVLCYKYAQEPELLALEYEVIKKWCINRNWVKVLNERKAEVLARFRHQMRESSFTNAEIRRELSLFNKAISLLPSSWNDFMNVSKGPAKSWILLLLFKLKFYVLLVRI